VLGAAWLALYLACASNHGTPLGPALWGGQLLLLLIVVVVHGSLFYGYAGIALYVAVGWLVSFVFEATSVSIGFPFGLYVHHSSGPRLLGVPLPAMFIYLIHGWFAWAVTRSIFLDRPWRKGGRVPLLTPLLAAFVLAGFDFPADPILATVDRLWSFAQPGGQFGVPITNNLGWIFTSWVLFQIFSLVEARFPAAEAGEDFWVLPCLVWVALALQYPILWSKAPTSTVGYGGRSFVSTDIFEASVAGSLFTLVFVGLLALACLDRGRHAVTSASRAPTNDRRERGAEHGVAPAGPVDTRTTVGARPV
jgi:putative membrane protein